MGVLLEKRGRLEEAVAGYKKAIYIRPDYALSYFNLGNIYRYQNKPVKARREYQNAINVLQRQPAETRIELAGDLTSDLLILACSQGLESLRAY